MTGDEVRAAFPLGRTAIGTIRRFPWFGKRCRGPIVGHRETKRGRWVVIIANTRGTASIPADGRGYSVHWEHVRVTGAAMSTEGKSGA